MSRLHQASPTLAPVDDEGEDSGHGGCPPGRITRYQSRRRHAPQHAAGELDQRAGPVLGGGQDRGHRRRRHFEGRVVTHL
ncbi:MAG TPA: hypothetical protein VGR26_03545 [Acidimicrobiales bacterium]|nr:hypothetical protein [Acidimicrobiales bacterium]